MYMRDVLCLSSAWTLPLKLKRTEPGGSILLLKLTKLTN